GHLVQSHRRACVEHEGLADYSIAFCQPGSGRHLARIALASCACSDAPILVCPCTAELGPAGDAADLALAGGRCACLIAPGQGCPSADRRHLGDSLTVDTRTLDPS